MSRSTSRDRTYLIIISYDHTREDKQKEAILEKDAKDFFETTFAAGCSTASVFQFDGLLPRKHEQLEPALESAEAASGKMQNQFISFQMQTQMMHFMDLT